MATARSKKLAKPTEHDDSPGVSALIAAMTHPLKSTLESIRQTILSADASITEGVKWNSPSFYCRGWFATIGCRKTSQIDVVLHCGAKMQADCRISEFIEDPGGLLTWPSRDRALLSFRSEADFLGHRQPFQRVITQWAEYQRRNVQAT